jgi:hypothetical protein
MQNQQMLNQVTTATVEGTRIEKDHVNGGVARF